MRLYNDDHGEIVTYFPLKPVDYINWQYDYEYTKTLCGYDTISSVKSRETICSLEALSTLVNLCSNMKNLLKEYVYI